MRDKKIIKNFVIIDNTIMSASETHSKSFTSNEEAEYKSNIPYNIDNSPIMIAHHGTYGTLKKEEKDSNDSYGFQILENVDHFVDNTKLSVFNVADYNADSPLTGSFSSSSTMGLVTDISGNKSCQPNKPVPYINPFPSPTLISRNYMPLSKPALAAEITKISGAPVEKEGKSASHLFDENVEEDIKCSPPEVIPPSPSSLQYDYNIPASNQPHEYPLQPTDHSFLRPGPLPHQSYNQKQLQYDQYLQTTNFYPNMWYPNAPHSQPTGYYRSLANQQQYNYSTYPNDPILDVSQFSTSGREARNRAEKNRRDKLNGCIQELSKMVPHISESQRRVDKTTILRCATHGLRLIYTFGKSRGQSRPQYTDSLMKLLDRFLIVVTCHGEIVLVSSSVEQHLGHCQVDLYGQNLLNITHPEDHNIIKQQLIPNGLDGLFHKQSDNDSNKSRQRTKQEEEFIDKCLREDKRNFTVRLARAGPRSEPTSYEIVKIEGSFRRSDAAPRGKDINIYPSTMQMIRRTRGRDGSIPLHTISGNDIVLIATARIIRLPKVINNVFEANAMKYKTRHLIDGRIIDCDQGIGIVAGYMTNEVRNLSPFTFMHQDDVRWVIVALRQMYDCKSSFGESTYRLITRNGNFIYLHSKGYLEIDKETQQVRSFICVNTLLDEEEGKRRVQEMKNKFSLIVNTKIPQSSIDEPASKNPQQLEKAILCLIQNLQKSPRAEDEDDGNSSTGSFASDCGTITCGPGTSVKSVNRSSIASSPNLDSSIRASALHFARSVKTPPLALVPPEPSSVKTSITKSVNVVNVTAAKHLRSNQQNTISYNDTHNKSNTLNSGCLSCHDEYDTYCSKCHMSENHKTTTTTGTISMHTNSVITTANTANKRSSELVSSEEMNLPKKRLKTTEIEQVLASSLLQLGKTLDKQLNAAIELRDKSNKYEVPNTNQKIDEIMEEHQMQSKIYVDIKSEYEVQKHTSFIDASTTMDGVPANRLFSPEINCNQQSKPGLSEKDNMNDAR